MKPTKKGMRLVLVQVKVKAFYHIVKYITDKNVYAVGGGGGVVGIGECLGWTNLRQFSQICKTSWAEQGHTRGFL